MGFKHSEESKRLMSEFRKGKPLSENSKKRLSALFSGELNPFWSKRHSPETLAKMRKSKVGELNPMFRKPKSEETLAKLRKKVYVYDNNKKFIKCYDSIKLAVKNLHIAVETIKKYLDTDKLYKNLYFFSKLQ